MRDFADSIFAEFRKQCEAANVYPFRGSTTKVDDDLRHRVRSWASHFALDAYDFPDAEYDKRWVIQPLFHKKKTSKVEFFSSKRQLFVIMISTRSGRIRVHDIPLRTREIEHVFNPEVLSGLESIEQHFEVVLPVGDIKVVEDYLTSAAQNGAGALSRKAFLAKGLGQYDARPRASKNKERARIAHHIAKDAVGVLARTRMAEVHSYLSPQILAEARGLAQAPQITFGGERAKSAIDFYNLIVGGQTTREQDFRRGALRVLQAGHLYFFDDKNLWQEVDAGFSIHKIVAKKMGVQPATIKHLYARSALLSSSIGTSEDRLRRYAAYLENIDISRWPDIEVSDEDQARINSGDMYGREKAMLTEEVDAFTAMIDGAEAYAIAFGRDAKAVFKEWASQLSKESSQSWTDGFRKRFARQIKTLQVVGGTKTKTDTIPFSQVIDQFKRDMSGINDMKADMRRRIILPLIMLEMERCGYELLKTDAADSVAKDLEQRLWGSAPPADQIAASSYWHSSRVNLQGRFQSAVYAAGGSCWHSLITEPYDEIKIDGKKAVFVPLTSDMALKDEGKAMGHCVGGYAINCLKYHYHIFSIRDSEDKRVSTFTCKETTDKDGKRHIVHVENSSHHNARPPEWAQKAAAEFMRRVNEGEIEPDWDAILASKADFLAREVDMTIGYAFREPEARDRVYQIYEPVLPRKMPLAARASTDGLANHLGVAKVVDEFLATRTDLAALGIRKKAVSIRPAPQQRHLEGENYDGMR